MGVSDCLFVCSSFDYLKIVSYSKIACLIAVRFFTLICGLIAFQDAFRNPVITTLATFAMGLGEFNFEENFINSNNSPFKWDLFILFPVCCIIVNCSLMNLMVSLPFFYILFLHHF